MRDARLATVQLIVSRCSDWQIGATRDIAGTPSFVHLATPQLVEGRVVAQVVVGNAGRGHAPLGPGAPSPWPSILVLWAIAAVIWAAILLHL